MITDVHTHDWKPMEPEGYRCAYPECEQQITDQEMANMNSNFRRNLEEGIAQ